MPLDFKEVTINDFSGGISDKYINTPTNLVKDADNFVITETGSLQTVDGYKVIHDQTGNRAAVGMFDFRDTLMIFKDSNLYSVNKTLGTISLPVKPNPSVGTLQKTADESMVDGIQWKNQLIISNQGINNPIELNRPVITYFDAGVLTAVDAGLPILHDAAITLTATNGLEDGIPAYANNYVYSIHYQYTYTVEGVTYEMVSTVFTKIKNLDLEIGPDSGLPASPEVGVTISNFPVISSLDNQVDKANITVRIFRTENNATTARHIADIAYGTASYVDTTIDADIISSEIIYTEPNTLESYPAPKCKYTTMIDSLAYYAFVIDEDSGETKPFRIIQSNAGAPYATHPSASIEVDDEIVGLSNIAGFPIVFTDTFIYRLEGQFDDVSGGSVRKRIISETVGCVSHKAAVRIPNAIIFMARNGVYKTDGYQVVQLPASLLLFNTIDALTDTQEKRDRISGTYDNFNERVYWSVGSGDFANDQWLILNLKTGGFTTASGVTFTSHSLITQGSNIYRGDDQGYVFEHGREHLTNYIVNNAIPATDWETVHIPYLLKTVGYDYGDPSVRKWATYATFGIKSDTNFATLPASDNDDGRVEKDLKFVRNFGTFFWEDPTFLWGDDDIRWRRPITDSFKRHYPKGTMRSRYKQIILKPADVTVYRSENYGNADASLIDILDPIPFNVDILGIGEWAVDSVNYSIAFADDGYEAVYPILTRTNTRLTINAPTLVPGLNKQWQIIGKPKLQAFELKTISAKVALLQSEGNEFGTDQAGDNA